MINLLGNDQKLLRHLDRLSEWQKTGFAYPISSSINLTNVCNHRCPDCMVIHMLQSTTKEKQFIPFDRAKDIINQLAKVGVKTVNLGGGGDPSMYKELNEILLLIKNLGMESSVTTNGTQLSELHIKNIIECCTFIRFSLDADGPEIYKLTHAASEKLFNRTIENIRKMCELKKKLKSNIEISSAYLVGPHTIKGIYNFTKLSKNLGVDHVRIRPFFTHGDEKPFGEKEKKLIDEEYKKSMKLNDDKFKVYFANERMQAVMDEKKYILPPCNIHHFHTQISADQRVWVCCHHLDVEGFCVGDLSNDTFENIWKSEKRKSIYNNINYDKCPNPCQYHRSNELLNKLSKSIPHENFI